MVVVFNLRRNMKAKPGKSSVIKWIVASVLLVVLVIGGYFGFQFYQDYRANKIYSKNEIVSFPDFDVTVTKAEYKKVSYPLSDRILKKYGGLANPENCKKLSNEDTWLDTDSLGWVQNGQSMRTVCERRNDARSKINQYISNNEQLVVDYKITAKSNIDTSKLKIELLPDSGRNLKEEVYIDAILSNEGEGEIISVAGAPGPVYELSYGRSSGYKPYHQSSIGGDINKGLERTGYTYTDIRKSENSVDVKVTYKNDIRIVRITR